MFLEELERFSKMTQVPGHDWSHEGIRMTGIVNMAFSGLAHSSVFYL
jgi:hypothetical protein